MNGEEKKGRAGGREGKKVCRRAGWRNTLQEGREACGQEGRAGTSLGPSLESSSDLGLGRGWSIGLRCGIQ